MKANEASMPTGAQQPSGFDPKRIPIAQFWKASMSVVILPIPEWDDALFRIFETKFKDRLSPMWAGSVIMQFKPQLMAKHYRLARAVQHTGQDLDPLAATIGAIRLGEKNHAKTAAEHIGRLVVKAFDEGDKATIARIRKLSAVPIHNHRNYQIWVAVDEVIRRQSGSVPATMPTTAEIRRYVEEHANDPSFNGLPGPKDHKGWTRLWQDSGAGLIIPKGTRGRKK